MSWKNILKREKLPLVPDEARFNIPTGNLKSPPESRYFENAKVDWMDSVQFVQGEINERYAMTDKYKRGEVAGGGVTMEEMDAKQVASYGAKKVATDAVMKVIDPYMEFTVNWDKKKNLQEANKEWEYLTHRVMLMVHTTLNNKFPTVEDAYKSRKLNGFLYCKGEYYQNLMKEKLTDTMEETRPTKKEPPKKRNYMDERKRRIEEMRGEKK